MTTHRQRFFDLLDGKAVDRLPYFPDLSTWYVPRRTPWGELHKYVAGELVPDADVTFHRAGGKIPMPEKFRDWTYLDFYRRFDWGVPVHLYDWYGKEYDGAEETIVVEGSRKVRRWRCPEGELTKVYSLAEDGSWCPTEFPVKTLQDLEIFRAVTARMHYVPRYERIRQVLGEIGQQGVLDMVIERSPFGKLVHELIGFEILSDHSDENLVAPQHYLEYCIPYYKRINEALHAAGKLVSTHLDGNFKGYMPFLHETGFDILDGCTPFPMTNWTPAELAAVARPGRLACWCGVPSTLFCQSVSDQRILDAARDIVEAFLPDGRLILNVGDIVSPTANIEQVIALGDYAAAFRNVQTNH